MAMRLSKIDRDLIIAMSIGDGCVTKTGQLMLNHCEKQEDYLRYKAGLIKKILCSDVRRSKQYHKQHKKDIVQYHLCSKRVKFLKVLRKVLYPNNQKTITRKLLNRINAQGLAIWWMDDGNRNVQYRDGKIKYIMYRLYTCLDKDANQIILNWFKEKWDLNGYISKHGKQFIICFGTSEGKKLSNIIREYVIDSMQYKISPVEMSGDVSKCKASLTKVKE